MSCLAFSCLVAAAAATAATAAGSAGPAAYLPTTELRALQGVAPVSSVGRFTMTVVVVKLASHCFFQQIVQKNIKEPKTMTAYMMQRPEYDS